MGTPERRAWSAMKDRCLNPRCRFFDRYGGRGIKVHESWVNDAAAFLTYVFEHLGARPSTRHSLDRIDNAGHYEPGNIRWASYEEQNRNRRSSKLDANDVGLIRHWLAKGYLQRDIGAAFGINGSTVSDINTGRLWADIQAPAGASQGALT
jgi:hypothetical protein